MKEILNKECSTKGITALVLEMIAVNLGIIFLGYISVVFCFMMEQYYFVYEIFITILQNKTIKIILGKTLKYPIYRELLEIT